MTRAIVAFALAAAFTASSLAQINVQPQPQPRPGGERGEPKRPALSGDKKYRYLIQQITMTDEQRKNAEGIIEMMGDVEPTIDLNKVQSLMQEIKNAQEKGDKAREQQLTEEIRSMGRGADNDKEFLANLEKGLTSEQKAELQAALERLERNPSGQLRPIDVVHAARSHARTPEQKSAVEAAVAAFRKQINAGANPNAPAPPPAGQQLDSLIESIKGALAADEGVKFEQRVNRMRPFGGEKAEARRGPTTPTPPPPTPATAPAPAKP